MHPPPSPRLSLAGAVALAALGGLFNAAAFPRVGAWPLVFLGTALILFALKDRRLWPALLIGFVGGFAFFGLHISWLTVYLGVVPWAALAGLESILFALGAALIALAWRRIPLLWPSIFGRLVALPAVLAALWTLREAIASVWPYGGFSWGRLAFSQSDSPFRTLVAWLGISGLSFVIAWLSALVLQGIRESAEHVSVRGIVVTIACVLALAVPAFPVVISGSVRVAAVQGNSDSGLFADVQQGQVLNDHLQATMPIINRTVDVVVWPENASDLNPLTNDLAAGTLDYVSSRMKAPLITGTITEASGGRTFNSVLLWQNGKGSVAQYDKMHPVPFAEYLPNRSFWYPFAPDLFDMVPRDFSIGTRPNVIQIGTTRAGVAICFDIVDDALISQMVEGGAQFIIAPSNNADFGHTEESEQQAAIARLRSIETGRSVVNDSTVGVTQIFAPDGRVIDQLPAFAPGALVRRVPLSTTVTPASEIGAEIGWLVSAFGLLALALATLSRDNRRGIGPEFLFRTTLIAQKKSNEES